jgi:hypothetical protein
LFLRASFITSVTDTRRSLGVEGRGRGVAVVSADGTVVA